MLLCHMAFRNLGKRTTTALPAVPGNRDERPTALAGTIPSANLLPNGQLAGNCGSASRVLAEEDSADIWVRLMARPSGFAWPTSTGREPLDGELQGALIGPSLRGEGGWGVGSKETRQRAVLTGRPGIINGMDFKPITAIIIPPDGPANIGPISQDLQTLQSTVGGYIEAVYTLHDEGGSPTATFWCNEEGKIQGLDINRRATALWYALSGGPTGDYLSGTVIVTGFVDGEGDVLPVRDELVDMWNSIHASG